MDKDTLRSTMKSYGVAEARKAETFPLFADTYSDKKHVDDKYHFWESIIVETVCLNLHKTVNILHPPSNHFPFRLYLLEIKTLHALYYEKITSAYISCEGYKSQVHSHSDPRNDTSTPGPFY